MSHFAPLTPGMILEGILGFALEFTMAALKRVLLGFPSGMNAIVRFTPQMRLQLLGSVSSDIAMGARKGALFLLPGKVSFPIVAGMPFSILLGMQMTLQSI